MERLLLLIALAVVAGFGLVHGGNNEFSWAVLSPFNYQTKRLSPGIYTGGRPTATDLSFLSQAGFASVLSVVSFPDDDIVYKEVVGDFPSSAREMDLVTDSSLKMIQLDSMALDIESVDRFIQAILSAPKPVYIHCHVGYTATLYSLLFQYSSGELISDVGTASIYGSGIVQGWDYQTNEKIVALVNSYTGAAAMVASPSINLQLTDGQTSYQNWFWSHRVGNDLWYNCGQILETQLVAIGNAGYGAVVSFRQDGEPTTHVISTDCSSSSSPCPNNHQFMNNDGSYNVTMEKNAVEAVGLRFFHLPVGSDSWNADTLAAYKPILDIASTTGPVLTHCKSGYRSSAFVVAHLAQANNQCTVWAVQQATEVGYSFDVSASDASVMTFFENSLGC
jgi:uncharacterized protein (TIGR01244 family)